MDAKRALVVDDSRSARISLKRMLEAFGLRVDIAESGEEALDYLKHHHVDAIFMDHEMPGMDGLETVVAIKNNPRTASIPVMMYTAKEGELYVSQARALGAIGVLPKHVQPGVLGEMLGKLGLATAVAPVVADTVDVFHGSEPPIAVPSGKSSSELPTVATIDQLSVPSVEPDAARPAAAEPRPDGLVCDAEPSLGASLRILISNMLSQHQVRLRSDILSSHREFARQVAAEIRDQENPALVEEARHDSPARSTWFWLLLVPLVILAGLYWQLRMEQNRSVTEASRLDGLLDELQQVVSTLERERSTPLPARAPLPAGNGASQPLIDALERALNAQGGVPFDGLPFDDRRAVEVGQLLDDLAAAGFRGTVDIEWQAGEFCLVVLPDGREVLAGPDMLVEQCSRIGHPLDAPGDLAVRESVAFAAMRDRAAQYLDRGLRLEIRGLYRDVSDPLINALPSPATRTAGELNTAARGSNRVHYRIIPAAP